MGDLFNASRDAIGHGAPIAFGLALLFGALSSVGPCMVARVTILSGLSRRTRREGVLIVGLFLAGMIAVYIGFALVLQLLTVTQVIQREIIMLAALAFGIAGIVSLVRQLRTHSHEHGASPTGVVVSPLAAAGLGALSAVNLSPCCTPWLIMALSMTSLQGNALYGAALMVPFSIGHALPLFVYGRIGSQLSHFFDRRGLASVVALGGAAFLVLVAVYYAVQI